MQVTGAARSHHEPHCASVLGRLWLSAAYSWRSGESPAAKTAAAMTSSRLQLGASSRLPLVVEDVCREGLLVVVDDELPEGARGLSSSAAAFPCMSPTSFVWASSSPLQTREQEPYH